MLFYEIKVNYCRQTGEDQPSNVKETYLVEGLTCADVENRLMEEIKPLIFGDCEVPSCKKVQLYDIVANGRPDCRWYKARVEILIIGGNGSEHLNTVSILLEAENIKDAMRYLNEYLQNLDCEVVSITRSPIIEVFRAIN